VVHIVSFPLTTFSGLDRLFQATPVTTKPGAAPSTGVACASSARIVSGNSRGRVVGSRVARALQNSGLR
jgi:hypothetical protein